MKFVVKNLTKSAPRLGILNNISGKLTSLDTPLVMLHTQGGQVPHITHEVLKLVSSKPHILQIPLVSMHNFKEAMAYFDGAISDFIGNNNDSICCLTLQDPSNLTQQGYHSKGKVPIWTKVGKVYYNSKSYMETVEAFKPDMFCLLSDGDTNQSSSQKRLVKAVENTNLFHKECLEIYRNSKVMNDMLVIAPVAGGYSLKCRQKCLDSILEDDNDVGGYLIDGLHNNGPEVEFLPFADIKNVVEYVVERVPPSKVRAVQGCWNPSSVIKLVKLGIDIFDTSYCRMLTERSAAMTFPIDFDEHNDHFEINLRQISYIDDFQPLVAGCQCPTCLRYSRGYIHHLLTVQELLGPVLIMIHNIHHFLRFFEKIRECIQNNTLDELDLRMETNFSRYQRDILISQSEAVVNDNLH